MFTNGQKVTTSGYPGTVVRMYSADMVEVQLAAGLVCVPVADVVPAHNFESMGDMQTLEAEFGCDPWTTPGHPAAHS